MTGGPSSQGRGKKEFAQGAWRAQTFGHLPKRSLRDGKASAPRKTYELEIPFNYSAGARNDFAHMGHPVDHRHLRCDGG